LPAGLAVPVMLPVEEPSVRPVGSAPPTTDHVYGVAVQQAFSPMVALLPVTSVCSGELLLMERLEDVELAMLSRTLV